MPAPRGDALYLVDGYALIYRAFFALISRPLTTKSGENTSAAWGVTNFLLRLIENYSPRYLGWVHDMGVSFRERTYPAYKATRQKLADEQQQDFNRSLDRIVDLLAAFRVPIIGLEGFEADDVIGTLATQAAQRGLQTVIVSGDKDFYQLIGPGIALLNPGRGGAAGVEEHWVDESNAAERLGVPPERVVDYLALVGDTSDNVPGVKGVGEKTAVELLGRFGDLDTVLARAHEIPGKRARDAVLASRDLARLSRDLVTIRRDVPIELELDALQRKQPDTERLSRQFAELEFRTLMDKLDRRPSVAPEQPGAPAPVEPVEPVIVSDPAGLAELVAACRGAALVALAAEASSSDARRARLVGLSLAIAPGRTWYLPFGHRAPDGELTAGPPPVNLPPLDAEPLRPLRDLLADAAVPKAGHDVKFSWLVLRRAGVELGGVAHDSALASFVLDPGRRSHAVEELAQDRLGIELPGVGNGGGRGKPERPTAEIPVAELARASAARSEAVLRLLDAFRPELEDHGLSQLLRTIETPLVGVLVDMEWQGVLVDRDRLAEIGRTFGQELIRIEREIYAAAGTDFNIASTPQLRTILFEKLQLPVLKRTKTGASTDFEVLEQLAAMGHDVPKLLIEYREVSKLKSTYVDALPGYVNPETGRIHTSFHQTGASTGRLSSSDPNLQNIPVRTERGEAIRRAFVAPPGAVLLTADYSQIELRLLAHLSGDPAFVQAFERAATFTAKRPR